MNFLKTLVEHFAGKPIDWDELEESLVRSDLGVPMTARIIKTLQEREAWSLMGINDVVKVVRQEISRVAEPARRSANQIQTDLSAELDKIIAWQVTGQENYRREYFALVEQQETSRRNLAPEAPCRACETSPSCSTRRSAPRIFAR